MSFPRGGSLAGCGERGREQLPDAVGRVPLARCPARRAEVFCRGSNIPRQIGRASVRCSATRAPALTETTIRVRGHCAYTDLVAARISPYPAAHGRNRAPRPRLQPPSLAHGGGLDRDDRIALALVALFLPGNLTTNGHVTGHPESERAESAFYQNFPPDPNMVDELVVVRSPTYTVAEPAFMGAALPLFGSLRPVHVLPGLLESDQGAL